MPNPEFLAILYIFPIIYFDGVHTSQQCLLVTSGLESLHALYPQIRVTSSNEVPVTRIRFRWLSSDHANVCYLASYGVKVEPCDKHHTCVYKRREPPLWSSSGFNPVTSEFTRMYSPALSQ